MILALGGYSESGKSTAGRFFESRGYARLKIGTLYRRIYETQTTTLDFLAWSETIEQQAPSWIAGQFLEQVQAELSARQASACTIESLYGDVLARELRQLLGHRFQVLYLHVDDAIRLRRQQEREGFATLEQAAAFLGPRDERKRAWGTDRLRALADFVVDNGGTREALHARLLQIARS